MHLATVSSIIKQDAATLVESLADTFQPLSDSTMLVTGAGGFLCSFLLDVIVAFNERAKNPCSVIAIDNFQSGIPERIEHLQGRKDITFIEHDLRKPFVPQTKVDWIVHGASIASPIFYRRFPLETIDVNIGGTRQVLDLLKGGARSMVHLSTSEIYGDPDPRFVPTKEDYLGNVSCTGPRACYDESKRVAETLCATYHRLHGVPIKVARPFNVYGPGQRIDDGRIIPDLMLSALQGKPIVLFSDGKATRSFCYISDAVKAILLLLLSDANGEAFNIGNDEREISMGDVAQLVSELATPKIKVEYKISGDPHYVTDNPQRRCPNLEKLRTQTSYRPTVPLAEGLKRTLDSYLELAACQPGWDKQCV